MLATPHIVGGAAVGKLARRAWIAFPLAFGLHFLLDFTPHIDSHALFGSPYGYTRPEVIMGILDFLVGVALVILVVGRRPGWKVIYGAAFFGIVIDLFENIPPGGHWWRTSHATGWISTFHHSFQHNVPPSNWPLGFGTQVIVLAIAIWIIRAPSKAPGNHRNV
jgi:hypothetical protein